MSFKERTDVTAVPAMGVVAETMVALVLAGEALRKFGGDSVAEFVRNAETLPSPGSEPSEPPTHVVLVGMMGVGQDDGRAACSRRASAGRSSTATSWSRRAPGGRSARSSRPTARRVPRRSRPTRSLDALATTDARR